jgi:hypothetical protein
LSPEGAHQLDEVLLAPPARDAGDDAHCLEVEDDEVRRFERSAHEHVHVLQVVVVDARRVQAAEQVAQGAREGAAGSLSSGCVEIREDRMPGDVGGHGPLDLAGHEEARAQHAGTALLDRGQNLGGGEAARRERAGRLPGTPRG